MRIKGLAVSSVIAAMLLAAPAAAQLSPIAHHAQHHFKVASVLTLAQAPRVRRPHLPALRHHRPRQAGGLRVIKREGVVAFGHPSRRVYRAAPFADTPQSRREVARRAPAFSSQKPLRRHTVSRTARNGNARLYNVQHRPPESRPPHKRPDRPWRPTQRELRNVGTVAGAAYAGEIVAEDALDGLYAAPPAERAGSSAVYNNPGRRSRRTLSVGSQDAGGFE